MASLSADVAKTVIGQQLKITGFVHASLPARLSCFHKVEHLASSDIVVAETRVVCGAAGQVAMKADHRLPQQDLLVCLWSTMRVELDKVPIRSSRDLYAGTQPCIHARYMSGLVGLNAAILHARQ